ncbi:MAG: bifunctional sulfate adenylyltransferase subunit 1/adenylylsulfate kinase [Phycisphaerales bacterium]|nr:bifunctional sulfate adenylyltransferase subunit 1/adenylylsulfate kinase [Phycisphaerales bacterium]
MSTETGATLTVQQYLRRYEENDLLRFLTCGSVDDGKSTLIGRLLLDTGRIYQDHMRSLEADSRIHGTQGGELDLALLVDGLKSEREQGITIDVAWRYFATAKRSFIIADCPGHEQFTRNMATGASHCQLAISLIDARHGVTTQTRRHAFISSLLGIRHVVAAVNKMDLVGFSESRFRAIEREFQEYCGKLGIPDPVSVPISARDGDNVVRRSERIPWYSGNSIIDLLESVPVDRHSADAPFRMCVQGSVRPTPDFRGFFGTVASGSIKPGDRIRVLPSGRETRLRRIASPSGDLPIVVAPAAALLLFEDEIDCARGDVIAGVGSDPHLLQRFTADLVWMQETPLVQGTQWLLRLGTKSTTCTVRRVLWESSVDTLEHLPAGSLNLNAIGRVEIESEEMLALDDYDACRPLGALVLVDKLTNATAAAGMVRLASAHSEAHWDTESSATLQARESLVSPGQRQARFAQKPATVLICGRPGAGKTAIAAALERMLFDRGHAAVVLDGQALRRTISRDLGFGAQARSENLRRAMDLALLLNEQGLIVIASMVAPQREARRRSRELLGTHHFVLVSVDGGRDDDSVDPTGFEPPSDAEITVPCGTRAADAAQKVIDLLRARGLLH